MPPLRLAGFALIATLAGMAAAKADIVYDLDPLVSTGANGPIAPIGFELTLADSFTPESFTRECNAPYCTSNGDFTTFTLAFTFGGTLLGTLNNLPDSNFEFTTGSIDGDSGSLFWATTVNTVSLTFGQGVWNATVDSDAFPDACQVGGCTASGVLVQVPEPSALWILGAAAIGLAAMKNRYRQKEDWGSRAGPPKPPVIITGRAGS